MNSKFSIPTNDNGRTPVIEFQSIAQELTPSCPPSSPIGEVIEFSSLANANPTPDPEPPNLVA